MLIIEFNILRERREKNHRRIEIIIVYLSVQEKKRKQMNYSMNLAGLSFSLATYRDLIIEFNNKHSERNETKRNVNKSIVIYLCSVLSAKITILSDIYSKKYISNF